MILEVKATNYRGNSMVFDMWDPDESGYAITKIDGLGPIKTTVNRTARGSLDGSYYNSCSGREGRTITLYFRPVQGEDIEACRQRLYSFFVIKGQVTLIITTEHRKVAFTGYVESNEPDIFSNAVTQNVTIVGTDTTFKAYNDSTRSTRYHWYMTGVEDTGLQFPLSNEIPSDAQKSYTKALMEDTDGLISGQTAATPLYWYSNQIFFDYIDYVNLTASMDYDGDVETEVKLYISFVGGVPYAAGHTNHILVKSSAGGYMVIDLNGIVNHLGFTLTETSQIIIDSVTGSKKAYIYDKENMRPYNIIPYLHDVSWFTLAPGENTYTWSAKHYSEYLSLSLEYSKLFEGV